MSDVYIEAFNFKAMVYHVVVNCQVTGQQGLSLYCLQKTTAENAWFVKCYIPNNGDNCPTYYSSWHLYSYISDSRHR